MDIFLLVSASSDASEDKIPLDHHLNPQKVPP